MPPSLCKNVNFVNCKFLGIFLWRSYYRSKEQRKNEFSFGSLLTYS